MAATTPRYRPLGALVLLSLLLTLPLLPPPSHAVTSAARDDSESSLSVRVVINQDDTYDMTVIGQLKSKSSSDKRGMQENCNPSDAGGPFEDLKASYSERNGLPYYARLSDPEFYFKATETRSDGPQLSLEEMQQGFTIGSYNEGRLFLLPNQSVWLIYSDLFYQKIADHFSQWFAGLSFSFEAGGED